MNRIDALYEKQAPVPYSGFEFSANSMVVTLTLDLDRQASVGDVAAAI